MELECQARNARHLAHVRVEIQSGKRQVVLGGERREQLLLDRLLRHQHVDLYWIFLPHAMGARDPLLEDRGIPWQVDVDDGVRRLAIPELKGVTRVTWDASPLSLSLRHRFLGAVTVDSYILPKRAGNPFPDLADLTNPRLDTQNYLDFSFAYDLIEDMQL